MIIQWLLTLTKGTTRFYLPESYQLPRSNFQFTGNTVLGTCYIVLWGCNHQNSNWETTGQQVIQLLQQRN